mmetsp:Transcript_41916/g.103387  ORF Transcript_41916/g.103387 Transcript_41916/m.103387 type:complete len:216 (-) Transcript_41916:302-949(-)
MGGFESCAAPTSCVILASADSSPHASTRTKRGAPPALSVPPTTESPSERATGTNSPVTMDWSTRELPLTTIPSAGSSAPGSTLTTSPRSSRAHAHSSDTHPAACASSAGGAPGEEGRTHRMAYLGASAMSARSASLVCRLAEASTSLPSVTKVISMAAVSKKCESCSETGSWCPSTSAGSCASSPTPPAPSAVCCSGLPRAARALAMPASTETAE